MVVTFTDVNLKLLIGPFFEQRAEVVQWNNDIWRYILEHIKRMGRQRVQSLLLCVLNGRGVGRDQIESTSRAARCDALDMLLHLVELEGSAGSQKGKGRGGECHLRSDLRGRRDSRHPPRRGLRRRSRRHRIDLRLVLGKWPAAPDGNRG